MPRSTKSLRMRQWSASMRSRWRARRNAFRRMTAVVVVDRNPVAPSVQVLLDLPHQIAREAAQVAQVVDQPVGLDPADPDVLQTL